MFAFHEANRVSYHAEGDEIILLTSPYDHLNNLSRRLAECLDGSQHVAVVQVAVLTQNTYVAFLIDIEPKDLAPKPVLHNHASRRSGGGIRPKIICLDDARSQASKTKQTEHYGRDQHDNLNGEHMIHFHRGDYSLHSLASKQGFVTISLLLSSEIIARHGARPD
jgi:hypothetical protein